MIKHRIVFAGCGGIAFRWLNHITKRDDCEILAIADKNLASAKEYCKKYDIKCNLYDNVKEAMEKENGNLLIDLTYVTAHCEIVTSALKAGYDVFGEKPMAVSVEQVNEMLKTVKETGKRYFVMQNRRSIDQVKKIKEVLRSGILGEPAYICGEIFVPADLNSIRNTFEYPQLQDNNIHSFDLARYLLDAKPLSVHYHSFRPKGSKYAGDSACDAVFEFDNDVTYSFRGYNGAEGCLTSWDNVWRIMCEKGSVTWDGEGDAVYEYSDKAGDIYNGIPYKRGIIKKPEVVRDQHDMALEDMFDALETGRTPSTDCTDNVYSIAMVLASVKSIKENRKVCIKVNENYPYLILE
ncbi:MAG: Gfo/Idh/MocA family oxidoreductase [Clostridia bacterium]|nr:Gfo/Idh/MocA family oxidoreductase [Clostridia bacterium]MBQ9481504.1 Gfo/Idh/MocA family oxidoreductase [Clostridia bacterium]